MNTGNLVLNLSEIGLSDINAVGGKNASLGELHHALMAKGINVPDGFATTAEAYRLFLSESGLDERIRALLSGLDFNKTEELQWRGQKIRSAILETPIPQTLIDAFTSAYRELCARCGYTPRLAVRSSATAEDLPEASFAGAAETFLNVNGEEELIDAIHRCYASLFTDRAISYRSQFGYDDAKIALSVGVQPMVRSDLACAGVIFTLDTESGFRDVVQISSAYGLGEFVVKGTVTPDEWTVFKPTFGKCECPIISRKLGSKESKLVYAENSAGTRTEEVPLADQRQFSLSDAEIIRLASWACEIEKHYSGLAGHPQPMDLEWAKDGITGELFIVQARPETVHSRRAVTAITESYELKQVPPEPLTTGQAVGQKISTGPVRIVRDSAELSKVEAGDVLVAKNTNPDWEPVMRRVSAIVTDQGGRTAHAAIVSRELGLTCVVGCGNATEVLSDGDIVTVCCAEGPEGYVYPGKLDFDIVRNDLAQVPTTRTGVMVNIEDPSQAFALAKLPVDGVGLARIEFIITNAIRVHPMAIHNFETLRNTAAGFEIHSRIEKAGSAGPREFFVNSLAEGIARIAAAFYPRPVIVRTSDFKTNEYSRLLGGAAYEPKEENPMLGFRGASRYYDDRYRAGFALECAALKKVRDEMGLANVRVMIPFCRTVEEGKRVIAEMAANGLKQGENGLEIYAMCELPSNAVSADKFLEVFDGYSIGSNDLTQLVLGVDRDSGTISGLFDEEDPAVKDLVAAAIAAAQKARKPIGICGQAPSDRPDFAAWLVEKGITSISLNADSVINAKRIIHKAEQTLDRSKAKAAAETK